VEENGRASPARVRAQTIVEDKGRAMGRPSQRRMQILMGRQSPKTVQTPKGPRTVMGTQRPRSVQTPKEEVGRSGPSGPMRTHAQVFEEMGGVTARKRPTARTKTGDISPMQVDRALFALDEAMQQLKSWKSPARLDQHYVHLQPHETQAQHSGQSSYLLSLGAQYGKPKSIQGDVIGNIIGSHHSNWEISSQATTDMISDWDIDELRETTHSGPQWHRPGTPRQYVEETAWA